MEQILLLLILFGVARMLGAAADRLGQSATVGEVLAGCIIALALTGAAEFFPAVAGFKDGEVLPLFGNLGIFFIVLFAGVEMQPREMTRHSGPAFAVALGGVLLPLAGGFALSWAYLPDSPIRPAQALLVGTALSVTAVPVTVRVFMELGLLHTRPGIIVVTAAVFDDVLGLLLLAVITSIIATGETPDTAAIGMLIGKVVAFFVLTTAMGRFILPYLFDHLIIRRGFRIGFSLLVPVAVGYALLAEALGMHFVLGPFVAGLFFEQSWMGEETYQRVHRTSRVVANRLFGPIFFAYIGMRLDFEAFTSVPEFLALLVLIAFFSKLIGAGIPALAVGLRGREATMVSVGMSARGAVGLVVAEIALASGLFAMPDPPGPVVSQLFSAIVITSVVTTIVTPVLLRLLLPRPGGPAPP